LKSFITLAPDLPPLSLHNPDAKVTKLSFFVTYAEAK
jgi:hypothetical protein